MTPTAEPALTTPARALQEQRPAFTLAEIAAALDKPRDTIQQPLSSAPAATQRIVRGRPVAAWHFCALPADLQAALDTRAAQIHARDGFTLLCRPSAPRPRRSLDHVSQDAIDYAVKLQKVLAAFLPCPLEPIGVKSAYNAAALDETGPLSWQQHFGWRCTPRHFCNVLRRVLTEDNGANDWTRLDLYLPRNAGKKPKPGKAALRNKYRHDGLADTIAALGNAARLTADDKEFLFDSAFRHFERLSAESPGEVRLIRQSLLAWLLAAAPGLAKNLNALTWSWRDKYAAWLQAGRTPSAISDKRRLASGNYRAPDLAADKKKIRDAAILNGGNEALAYRLLRQRGQLSEAFVNYYTFDPRQNKSYVPRAVRDEITPAVEMCGPLHQGPRAAKLAGPYIPRDWSDVHPGQWFSADDVNWNNYFYDYDETGQLIIERGECLVMIDLRTGYPLHYVLIAGKYNSRHIRSLILRTHDLHGLPSVGLYLERGVWKSRFIEGNRKTDSLHWRETERGLREHGLDLQVRHATTPRAKTIEGLFHILQDRQRDCPGYVGPNEQVTKFERTQEFIARARAGKEHPGNQLLSMEQWRDRLDAIFAEYLADPQNGKMLDGKSPAEMWAQRHVLRKLPDDARYILATHKKMIRVRQEGIILEIGGERKAYCNEQTGALIGRDVLAFYNVDCPDLLTVSDLKRQNYFTVKRISLPALSATKEQFAEVHAAVAGHRKAAKIIYGNIPHPERSAIVRDNSIDPAAQELGRFHNAQTEAFHREQTVETRKLRKIQTAAATGGATINPAIRNTDRVLEGIALEAQALARIQEKEHEAAYVPAPHDAHGHEIELTHPPRPNAVKTYILDAPAAAPSPRLYWTLWKQLESLKPGLNRHALTQRAIGRYPKVEEMAHADLAKMIDVFSAMLREARAAAKTQP